MRAGLKTHARFIWIRPSAILTRDRHQADVRPGLRYGYFHLVKAWNVGHISNTRLSIFRVSRLAYGQAINKTQSGVHKAPVILIDWNTYRHIIFYFPGQGIYMLAISLREYLAPMLRRMSPVMLREVVRQGRESALERQRLPQQRAPRAGGLRGPRQTRGLPLSLESAPCCDCLKRGLATWEPRFGDEFYADLFARLRFLRRRVFARERFSIDRRAKLVHILPRKFPAVRKWLLNVLTRHLFK